MVKHNRENMKKVANKIVDGWDMDTLVNFAKDSLIETYKKDKKAFAEACEDVELFRD